MKLVFSGFALAVFVELLAGCSGGEDPLPPILEVWNFGDPQGTLHAFERLDSTAVARGEDVYRAEVITQIARCQGLMGRFDEAHATLDQVGELAAADHPRVKTRVALERGRVLNSSGHPEEARPVFIEAWEAALEAGEDYLAGDAAHMVAIVAPLEKAEEWTERGRAFALDSEDTSVRHWLGPLHNNLGWSYYEAERYGDAVAQFRLSQEAYEAEEDAVSVLIARYSTAKALRSRGDAEQAVQILEEVDAAFRARDEIDGYVLEELAEGYLTLGKKAESRRAAEEALEILSQDTWFVQNQADRLKRLRELTADPE
jgi:tetratricopeptide (TPR) repeat protein